MNMQENERKKLYAAQTEELYAAIGRFAVKFEHVCHAMSNTVLWALHKDGLKTQTMADAVLTGLTADPLRRTFGAVLAELRGDDDHDQKIISDVVNRVLKLTEARNNIIHRTWFIGWASAHQEDFSTVAGWKFKHTRKGVEFKPESYTVAKFNEHSAEADQLTNIIGRITGCLLSDRPLPDN